MELKTINNISLDIHNNIKTYRANILEIKGQITT